LDSTFIVHERRRDLELRAVFDEVYARVEGFFDPAHTWGGAPLTLWVYRVVRESYPHLDHTQVHTLVAATQRVYRARHAPGAQTRAVAPAAADPANEAV
jgi:hypothetical protein